VSLGTHKGLLWRTPDTNDDEEVNQIGDRRQYDEQNLVEEKTGSRKDEVV
jgi:hypothetical protein